MLHLIATNISRHGLDHRMQNPRQCPIFFDSIIESFDAIFPELVEGNILKGFVPLCLGGTTMASCRFSSQFMEIS